MSVVAARVAATDATGAVELVIVTAVVAVALPTEFDAVSVYVAADEGLTLMLSPETAPTPWSIDREVAPATVHVSVADPPGEIVAGVARNDEMTGGVGVALADSLDPPQPRMPSVVKSAAPTFSCSSLTSPPGQLGRDVRLDEQAREKRLAALTVSAISPRGIAGVHR